MITIRFECQSSPEWSVSDGQDGVLGATDPDKCPAAHYKICTPPLIIKGLMEDKLSALTALHTALNFSLHSKARRDCSTEHRNVHRSVP